MVNFCLTFFKYQRIVIALTTLYQATCNKIAKLKQANEETSRVQEWEDVLIENVHANLTKLWLFAAGKLNPSLLLFNCDLFRVSFM